MKSDDTKPPWRPPTRRLFVAMLASAAAALAIREQKPVEPKRSTAPRASSGTTRWIGHC